MNWRQQRVTREISFSKFYNWKQLNKKGEEKKDNEVRESGQIVRVEEKGK